MAIQSQAKQNKTHFIFPRELLLEIDKVAGKRKRSAFVIQAAREKLDKQKFDWILRDAAGAWSDKNHPELKTKKDVARYIRNFRKLSDNRLKKLYE
ncbi:hypothetical protein COT20_02590 [bacterium (Candidatus Gribaldobacteria) CG08_land_8_20_14_0_20_39_15]|uniref:Ribbon-helix-helix protein CopG domain-containing protein n=1 Tax=bacterium (Candidatus Gribaldobacteria) CG08_land_8_20_14_0_20_39_15 TaxID=2014273 RepID=A0A2M6XU48_9BACT|nr:MAG: hypothetical protein COT20_02590 [bacterium (Candidatus Gribaldobacteria) CG08_land_8_20_14_0_20_39_15]